MDKLIRNTKKFVYWLGFTPSENSRLYSPRREYRVRMAESWAY